MQLLGTVKNRDLPPHFRNADVFIAPSITTHRWEEQVGMTNIQAMASGVPVISTLSGAIPEYVPDGVAGILVPEQDPRALAEAIRRITVDNELHRILVGKLESMRNNVMMRAGTFSLPSRFSSRSACERFT